MSLDVSAPLPPACCGLLELVATERASGWVIGDHFVNFCPFCGGPLIDGPPRDEPALPIPSAEMIERGKHAFAELAAWNRSMVSLLDSLDQRFKRRAK